MGDQSGKALWAQPAFWKSALVIAPLIGTALFFASGTLAQTTGGGPAPAPAVNGTVAPIAAPDAARRKGPKVKVKDATGRVANPTPTGEPTADAPVAPIASPEAARGKGVSTRPKVLDAQPNARVANPTPAAEPVAPIASPEAARTGRPKERDKEVSTREANPVITTEPVATPEAERTGRPKERDKPASNSSRTGRPKERDDGVRTHTKRSRATTPSRGTNLLLPALGGAAAIVAIIAASSGNDRPTSP